MMQYSYTRNKSEYLKVSVLGNWRDKIQFSSYFFKNKDVHFLFEHSSYLRYVFNHYTLSSLF